ncbi:MAG TPA: ATP-binding protein [Thermoanaerobaculia bacterium]|nr:ATP-binding protein [Thermoanaerobaculia bacterium]
MRAGTEADTEEFRTAAEELIRLEREKRHHLLANDLERILYGERGSAAKPLREIQDLPKDRERGLALVEVREPVRDLNEIVLSDENRSVLQEILLEQSRVELLGSYGLRPISRLLFCGPPGCGKTLAAEVLSTELGLHLATVRFDAVVSSFLGETAANLRKVFDFLATHRVVALFDEFDAIGKEREDAAEHGELKRVVNSFLQMVDAYRSQSLLVAATNHERLLDRALWRRFDEVLFFDKPNLEQVRQLLSVKLRGVRHDLPVSDPGFLNQFTGFTHSAVERVLIRAIKAMALKGRLSLTMDLVADARDREERRDALLAKL